MGVAETLDKVDTAISSSSDRSALLRTQNLLNHIYHRLHRICHSDKEKDEYDECVHLYKTYANKLNSLLDGAIDHLAVSNSAVSNSSSNSPLNICVTCEGSSSNLFSKLKFDGKSCVRAFMQRANEFCLAKNIKTEKLLRNATEIFSGDALHWYRGIKDSVLTWDELTILLLRDFSQADFDYRLLAEIRSRTQGEKENIIIYLSIMSGLFSRLTKQLSEDDKLEIILHNIRPCYANALSSVSEIKSIDELRTLCRNYENIQSRLFQFKEPPKATSETLAPDLAYVDSGSGITILGNGMHELLGLPLVKENCISVTTAGGQQLQSIGFINVPISFEDQFHILKALVIPEMKPNLILGIDFWRKFKLCPKYISSVLMADININPTADASHQTFIQGYSNLSEAEKQLADNVVKQYNDISSQNKGLGVTSLITHHIDTGDSKPIRQRYYRLSPEKQRILVEQVDEMLSLDVIEPCESAWSSPVLLVTKKSGEPRFCLDSRKLNSVTKRDAYNLPYISEILDNLRDARYLTSIDLSKAFWQIPIAVEDRDKTAFYVPGRGTYRFKRTAFGLTNAPATQQRLVDLLFSEFDLKVFAYLDDIIVISKDFNSHVTLLLRVLDKLKEANLTINLEKCNFFASQLKYLGYVVDSHGLRTDPSKVEAILNFPTPTCRKDLKRFLGTATWYRRFVPNFSTIAGPLNKLTSVKGTKSGFNWTSEADDAFQKLKECLVSAPVLSCPDYSKPFEVHTDASNYGIGAMLTQSIDGKEHPIAYMSKSLTAAERNYSITERETLAVVLALEHWRCYIENGQTFTVYTDHSALKWFLSISNPTGRLARWGVRLSAFNFILKHRRGVDNVIPDALSRSVP
ncbi:jg1518, partial [Pararge aegeria aegeria]